MSPCPVPAGNSAAEKPSKKVSRLRAMFGMKGEVAIPPPITNGNDQLSVPSNGMGRRRSIRKKNTPVVVPTSPVVVPTSPVSESPRVSSLEPILKETMSQPPPPEDHPALKTIAGPEEHPALKTFTAFDQGPLDDPAFVPSGDVSEVSDIESSFEDAPVYQEPQSIKTEPAVQDKWAKIRKNAAERAKAQAKAAEEVSVPVDDTIQENSETSGEESTL